MRLLQIITIVCVFASSACVCVCLNMCACVFRCVCVCISVFVWLVANLLPRSRHRQQLQIHTAEELLHVFILIYREYATLTSIKCGYFNNISLCFF